MWARFVRSPDGGYVCQSWEGMGDDDHSHHLVDALRDELSADQLAYCQRLVAAGARLWLAIIHERRVFDRCGGSVAMRDMLADMMRTRGFEDGDLDLFLADCWFSMVEGRPGYLAPVCFWAAWGRAACGAAGDF